MAKQSASEQFDQLVQAVLSRSDEQVARPAAVADLVHLAADLCDLPRTDFRSRLKAELQRRATMTPIATNEETNTAKGQSEKAVDPIRPGFHTITPYLIVNEAAQLIDFVKDVFDGEEQFRSIGSAGGIHCEMRVGDSMLMIGGGGAWRGTPAPTALHVYVRDTDAVYQRALAAGATSLRAPADQDYGDRDASVRDPYGNHWYIGTHRGSESEDFIPRGLNTVNVYLHPRNAEENLAFVKRAFGGEELERAQDPEGVIHHAKVRIGSSVLEMGQAHAEFQPMPTTVYLYVEDCDDLYDRAVSAGAMSLSAPADQPYGDRNAGVQDPFGNTWYLSTHIKDVVG
jgi:PhnB protein